MDPLEKLAAEDLMPQRETRNYGMSLSNEVNMSNCYKHCQHLFHRHESIHFNVLIAFWMMAGYLGPIDSVEEAYKRGHKILLDLTYGEGGMLKLSDQNPNVIEFRASTDPEPLVCSTRKGLCHMDKLGFGDLVDLDILEDFVVPKDGMIKSVSKATEDISDGATTTVQPKESVLLIDGNVLSRQDFILLPRARTLGYLACFKPRPGSLKPLLSLTGCLSVLLLRDCELLQEIDIRPLAKFNRLTVLEISGLSQVAAVKHSDMQIISQLSELRSLHLSDFLTEELPKRFFDQLLELRWVILRGFTKLVSLPSVRNLVHLKMLDVSHCSALQKILSAILSNPELQMLDFSYTALKPLPSPQKCPNLTHFIARGTKVSVLSCLKQVNSLEVLDLSGPNRVHKVTQLAGNKDLKVLDLSRTEIESIDFLPDMVHLHSLILQGCASLTKLPQGRCLTKLEVFDLSGCVSLEELPEGLSDLESLKELNLSLTSVSQLPRFSNLTSLLKLSLRGLKVVSLEGLESLLNIEELDLSGLQILPPQQLKFDFIQYLVSIQILDLSQTCVSQLPELSNLEKLRKLILKDCQRLEAVPDIQHLTNLEVLDLSLPDRTTTNNFQAESRIEDQGVLHLSSLPSSLQWLMLKNRSCLQNLLPLTSVGESGYLDLRSKQITSDSTDQVESSAMVGPSGVHLRRTGFHSQVRNDWRIEKPLSGFDRFKDCFNYLDKDINCILQMLSSTTSLDYAANMRSGKALKKRFRRMPYDLGFIRKRIGFLRRSDNREVSEQLLHGLVDTITDISDNDHRFDYSNIREIIRVVVKLKLLITRNQVEDNWESMWEQEEKVEEEEELKGEEESSEEILQITDDPPPIPGVEKDEEEGEDMLMLESETERKRRLKRSNNMKKVIDLDAIKKIYETLSSSYSDLTPLQRKCLLCFSVFPCTEFRDKNTRVMKLKSLVVKKSILIQWWYGEKFLDQTAYSNLNPEIDETDADQIGNKILNLLEEKGFIEPIMTKRRESGSCCMRAYVHSFVTARAKEEHFFEFKHGKLTPHFALSNRACLLTSQSQHNSLSSYRIWASYTNFPDKLESFNRVCTLFNVNESLIDIDVEWFSRMKDLSVLHLRSWCSPDPVEVVNRKFLKHLNEMKKLRLLNLQGLSSIKKLSDSVSNLTNLRLLNLRQCIHLKELPKDVGSLKNLTHLDVTHCKLLSDLPIGIRLLSKLEVFKGFRITGARQKNGTCKLEDLLNLGRLHKLSVFVDKEAAPRDHEHVQVLKRMKNLDYLKITWESGFMIDDGDQIEQEQQDVKEHELDKGCVWLKKNRREPQLSQQNSTWTSRNLRKLVLRGLPNRCAASLLAPAELEKLEELHIIAGNIRMLTGIWNVKILRMKYLSSLSINWIELISMFPRLKYLEMWGCKRLALFPCDDEGIWTPS